ncbi:high-affinity branched-chain amino acid transport ATP-binding protein LivF [bacterium BMS3Abin07]|nr:high-affinity branched-chain amino acid transport ATP-binding protein LivF [bacterium BMS3Abin07]GBE33314.1 high-affinity branched-chain amino acid transport ATP-binding protein LivF [bacterium BMS3Bbin05]HDO22784.1 ABC transporter ATP-binding protein [Nitrospirota bacterium]
MLEISNIDVSYGDVQVIWDVSFVVRQAEVVALIGANGAGKSTILKTISGLLRPKKGGILFEGKAIHNVKPYNLIELGIAHVPEGRRLFSDMTVEENLDMGSLKGDAKDKRPETKEMVFDLFPRLKERRKQATGTLSGGEQQMVAVGRGLMSRPRLIMFDEPSLGLAPILVKDIFNVINKIREEGTTVLIVEQNVKQTLATADRAYVLENGRVVIEGTGESLLGNEHVKTAYLGV